MILFSSVANVEKTDSKSKTKNKGLNSFKRPIEFRALFDMANYLKAKFNSSLDFDPNNADNKESLLEHDSVTNGIKAKRYEFPWMAILGKKLKEGIFHLNKQV